MTLLMAEAFRDAAHTRLDGFYRQLAEFGEVSPVVRLRLEGFLEAGLVLGLADRAQIECWVADYGAKHLDDEQSIALATAQKDSEDGGVLLPVRWRRAPVYPS